MEPPDPDIILGQWWLDEKGNLLIQPVPHSGKASLAGERAVVTGKNLDQMAKSGDGYLHPAVVEALGLTPVPREERTFRNGEYHKIGASLEGKY